MKQQQQQQQHKNLQKVAMCCPKYSDSIFCNPINFLLLVTKIAMAFAFKVIRPNPVHVL